MYDIHVSSPCSSLDMTKGHAFRSQVNHLRLFLFLQHVRFHRKEVAPDKEFPVNFGLIHLVSITPIILTFSHLEMGSVS